MIFVIRTVRGAPIRHFFLYGCGPWASSNDCPSSAALWFTRRQIKTARLQSVIFHSRLPNLTPSPLTVSQCTAALANQDIFSVLIIPHQCLALSVIIIIVIFAQEYSEKSERAQKKFCTDSRRSIRT